MMTYSKGGYQVKVLSILEELKGQGRELTYDKLREILSSRGIEIMKMCGMKTSTGYLATLETLEGSLDLVLVGYESFRIEDIHRE